MRGLVRFGSVGGVLVEARSTPGRGAWVCAGSLGCLERAIRTRGLARALRVELSGESVEEAVERWRGESGAEAPA